MATGATGEYPARPPETGLALREIQSEGLLLVLPVLYGASLILFGISQGLPELVRGFLPGVLLLLLQLLVWALRRISYLASAWALVIGCVAVNVVLVAWSGISPALCLLAWSVGLAALFVSIKAGVLTAAACTLLLGCAPPSFLPADPTLRGVSLIGCWSTVMLIWLTVRPLWTTLQWAWSSYQESQRLLEEGRDARWQLKQTLADLADANVQLTRLNQLAQGLRQAAEEARRAKEQFVTNVSHELRTPLNMIVGFSELIMQAPKTAYGRLPAALLADLAVIHRNSQHLAALIDDVLDLSQVEAGQMALARERVELREIVDAAVEAIRPLFAARGLDLHVEVSPELWAFCDSLRVREVLLNLLSNAGRFTEQGGATVKAWTEGNDVVVAVADTGPGISVADQARLFQPFHQVDGSLRRRHGGSGLGLAISRTFVELHGGRMWLESEPGRGTTIYFCLPLAPPVPMDSGAARWLTPDWEFRQRPRGSLAPISAPAPRLVVLEAGSTLHRLLGRSLGGVEIVSVRTLDEALRELAAVPAQALLVNEPAVSQALERILQSAGLPFGAPAIICAIPGAREAAHAVGAAEYLVKPVSREALLGALDRLQLRGGTLLIVDDESEAIRLFWRIVSSSGHTYRVLTATDGQQALNILAEQRPDAMLVDLVMPGMDGFQLLAAKGADPALADIPAIVVSARDPTGQPIVTNAVGITRGGGLSVAQLLACVEAVSGPLVGATPPGRPAQPAGSSG
ncbi:MAG: hypothetical protein CVU38_01295 [Chloroflexi bacterium HGW-Chloroflexi-1]|nr:MAG: hypothetical protein CVU38_01295 [Chloroflexi bacterium HGW-Chloroflexi-1]